MCQFGVRIWPPETLINRKIKQRATKLVPEIAHLPYKLQLHHLNLYSLYCRRQGGALIGVYKLVNHLSRVTPQPFFVFTNSVTRGHNQQIFRQQCRLISRLKFFTNSVISQWNSLPDNAIESINHNSFKNDLDHF